MDNLTFTMALDHSLTYRKLSLKNLPHRIRLAKILAVMDSLQRKHNFKDSYLDIGCSNGYITEIVRKRFRFNLVTGLDHNRENIELARSKYQSIDFELIDLNIVETAVRQTYEVITCFETLEHVGNLKSALRSILNLSIPGGFILITVPIEINTIGTLKFLAKAYLYNYSLDELPGKPSKGAYLRSLLRNEDISKFRDIREGWGTHFGFDYRVIDEILTGWKVGFKATNFATTRLYVINNQKHQ